MHLRRFAASALALAAFVLVLSLASAQEDDEPQPKAKNSNEVVWSLAPGTSQFLNRPLPGGKRVLFVAHGSTPSARLGIYVYDVLGNCVAWDDVGSAKGSPGVAVADVAPGNDSLLQVEVHNLGLTTQKATLTNLVPPEAP